MKKSGLILVAVLLIASCSNKKESISNNITVDTLNVSVIVLKGVSIDTVININN